MAFGAVTQMEVKAITVQVNLTPLTSRGALVNDTKGYGLALASHVINTGSNPAQSGESCLKIKELNDVTQKGKLSQRRSKITF